VIVEAVNVLTAARQGNKIARPNRRFEISDPEGALALDHVNRLFVGAIIMARKGGCSGLDLVNAGTQAMHPGSRGKGFAPIAKLALGSFSPRDLILIHDIRRSHFGLSFIAFA
jgi:hypothetical protein